MLNFFVIFCSVFVSVSATCTRAMRLSHKRTCQLMTQRSSLHPTSQSQVRRSHTFFKETGNIMRLLLQFSANYSLILLIMKRFITVMLVAIFTFFVHSTISYKYSKWYHCITVDVVLQLTFKTLPIFQSVKRTSRSLGQCRVPCIPTATRSTRSVIGRSLFPRTRCCTSPSAASTCVC